MEATVFGQVGNVDKLLTMLRQLNPDEDNLADNEEIQVSNCLYITVVAKLTLTSRNCTNNV